MRGKGHCFLESEVNRIVALLYSTDLPSSAIARRMRCSVSAVNSLNRKMNVRKYDGHRTSWTCAVIMPADRHIGTA
jgi:hypothetical protein